MIPPKFAHRIELLAHFTKAGKVSEIEIAFVDGTPIEALIHDTPDGRMYNENSLTILLNIFVVGICSVIRQAEHADYLGEGSKEKLKQTISNVFLTDAVVTTDFDSRIDPGLTPSLS